MNHLYVLFIVGLQYTVRIVRRYGRKPFFLKNWKAGFKEFTSSCWICFELQ